MVNIAYYFSGTDKFSIVGKPDRLLNLLELYKVDYMALKVSQCGVSFVIRSEFYKFLTALLCDKKIEYKAERNGLPEHLRRLIRRPGIIIGCVIFIAMMFFYGRFVFDIKINGNERLTDSYITDALRSRGFSVGTYFPSVDFDLLSNAIPGEYKDISWIFVNMMGNVAFVEVREYSSPHDNSLSGEITDLVAKSSGQIYRYEVMHGIVRVNIGETVFAGQRLVSGYGSGKEDFLYSGRSVGKVFAKVSKSEVFTVQTDVRNKITEKTELIGKSLVFLGKEIKLLQKSGTNEENCDIIVREYKLLLKGGAELPLTVREVYAVYYSYDEKELTYDEAKIIAERQLAEYIGNFPDDTVVLGINRNDIQGGGYYTINCRIYCIEDIAREIPASPPLTAPQTQAAE